MKGERWRILSKTNDWKTTLEYIDENFVYWRNQIMHNPALPHNSKFWEIFDSFKGFLSKLSKKRFSVV
ncbi:hypothetical protein SAMN02787073_3296 [Chryseobacterium vrystaatense]|uniref:Uncharacterized protein n=1 Tax=Chryseobacterium vrystaatense TaxID=307480 RepID=A0A1M5GAV3_9FLAO|nr:hypothetical protein SAMN02787073_3296 [Chryseobacterium vrystaatense]